MRATLEDDVRGTEVGRGIVAGLEAVGVSRTAAADVDLSTRAITEHPTKGHREGIVGGITRPAVSHEDGGDDAVGHGHVGLGARTRAATEVDITEHAIRVTRATLADGQVRSRVIEDERAREVGERAGQNPVARVNPCGAGGGVRVEDDCTRAGDRILQADQAIRTDHGQRRTLRDVDGRG